jgi:hypothetical protein
LSNEDLTTWEKMTQIMISLGMAIPTLSMGFKSLATAENLALINSLRLKKGLQAVEVQGKVTGATMLKAFAPFLPIAAIIAGVVAGIIALGNEFKKE